MEKNSHTGVARRERRKRDTALTLLLLAVPVCATAWLLSLLPQVRDGAALRFGLPWAPSLGVSLAFQVDGLSLLHIPAHPEHPFWSIVNTNSGPS